MVRKRKKYEWIKPWITVGAILLIWELLCRAGIFSSFVLPSPERVGRAFLSMARSGELLEGTLASVRRVLVGFAVSFVLAFAFGVLSGLAPSAAPYYRHILEFLRHVPPMSLIPLIILWCGIGETGKIVIIVLTAFFPIFLNTHAGLAQCDPKLLEVGRMLEMSPAQSFFKIRLPSALPSILLGMRIGLGYCWRSIIGAEMIAAASGLGFLILDAQALSRIDKVIVGILTIGCIGWLTDLLFGWATGRLTEGGTRA